MDLPQLRCVECGRDDLTCSSSKLICGSCGKEYRRHSHNGVPVILSHRSQLKTDDILAFDVSKKKLRAHLAERHWRTGSLTDLLASCPRGRLLSYGCGAGGDRKWLERTGYSVTACDVYPGPFTDIICDGHELPFASSQFDVVTSIAVFEHLYDPFQAATEKYRVLRPGGALVGSAAFLEPFHANSYFHMSHLGLTEVLRRAGFQKIQIYPGWSWIESLNGSFWLWNRFEPLRAVTGTVNRLRYTLGLALWRIAYALIRRRSPSHLNLTFCGSLLFKAEKPHI